MSDKPKRDSYDRLILRKKKKMGKNKDTFINMTAIKYDSKGKPIMKIVPSGVAGKSDTLYNAGTNQLTNKITGKKGKKKTLWAKKINKDEF